MDEVTRPGQNAGRPLAIPPFAVLLLAMLLVGVSLLIGRFFVVGDRVPDVGGTYTEAVTGVPTGFNPLAPPFNEADRDVTTLLFTGLTRLDGRAGVIPDLATRWDMAPDGRAYEFTIRPDARWHDGRPVTADDVVFTIRTIQDPEFRGFNELANFWRGFTVEKVDERRVRFNMAAPYAPFLSATTVGLLPNHLLGNLPADQVLDSPFNVQPVGNGPFRLARATTDTVTLEAFEAFPGGRPWLDRIVLRFYPDDSQTLAAVQRREAQGVFMTPQVAATSSGTVLRDERLRALAPVRASWVGLFLNTRDPLFADERVRQAIAFSLDRPQIIREAVGGQAVVAQSPLLPNTWAWEPVLADYNPDRGQAGILLDAAGWRAGPDGVRRNQGNALAFSLLSDDDPVRVQVVQVIARQLGQAGIRAEPSVSGYTGLLQNFLVPRRYQAIVYGVDFPPDPDPYLLWHSTQAREDGFNFSSFTDTALDRLLERARTTPDQAQRREAYVEFQRTFAQLLPSIPLYNPTYLYVQDRELLGVEMGTLFEPAGRFADARSWYVNTRARGAAGVPAGSGTAPATP